MKNSKVLLSVIMVMVLIVVSVAPTFAVIAPEDSAPGVVQVSKINSVLAEKMATATDEELLPVWVWLTDPDLSNVESMVQKQTGLTKDNLAVDTNVSTTEVSRALDMASMNDTESAKTNAANQLQAYLEATKESRAIEKERTDKYLSAKRKITRDLYIANNNRIINNLKVDSKDIIYKSKLTPTIIISLTKGEILEIAKSNYVVSIEYYCNEIELPYYETQKDTMQVDAVSNIYGLSGEGVNILFGDANYVRSDISNYSDIINQSNISTVINGELHTTTDTSVMPSSTIDHANHTACALQAYAENVLIYSLLGTSAFNVEWALDNCDIDIMDINLGIDPSTYNTYSSYSKWYDGLVSTYDVVLIASAGNSEGWSPETWPHVISPANSYNSIAVGAYISNGSPINDTMHNFRYTSVTGDVVPRYKPDVVIAAPNTSTAAPALSGIVAMMIELEPSLSSQPEAIKAILMASCHRKVKPTEGDSQESITSGLTQKQGAGAVDAYRAIKIVLDGTYGTKTATSYGLSQTATFALSEADDVNVSIAWSRENINNGIWDTTLGTLQELELSVYNGANLEGSSTKTNAGKQMVYLSNLSPNTAYTIKVNKTTNNNEPITYGYAWSSKNYDLADMNIQGSRFVNKTLTTDLQYIDGKALTGDEQYLWERSADGTNWQSINGANSDTYTLTQYDSNKFIRCRVTLPDNTLSGATTVIAQLNEKVLRYGDANLDGNITILDVTAIQRYINRKDTFNQEQMITADVSGDGRVTSLDVTHIQLYLSNSNYIFPVEE